MFTYVSSWARFKNIDIGAIGKEDLERLREGISEAWAEIVDVQRRNILGLQFPNNRLASIIIVAEVFEWEAEQDSKAKSE